MTSQTVTGSKPVVRKRKPVFFNSGFNNPNIVIWNLQDIIWARFRLTLFDFVREMETEMWQILAFYIILNDWCCAKERLHTRLPHSLKYKNWSTLYVLWIDLDIFLLLINKRSILNLVGFGMANARNGERFFLLTFWPEWRMPISGLAKSINKCHNIYLIFIILP